MDKPFKIIITGDPGAGKTTLVESVLGKIRARAGGFYTREIREGGERKGFKIITLDGEEAVLAHVDFTDTPRVGKYGVDVSVVDRVAVPGIEHAILKNEIVVIDEIARMELLSKRFCDVVAQALDSPHAVVATAHTFPHPFTDAIKARPDVTLVHITVGNRNQQRSFLEMKLGTNE